MSSQTPGVYIVCTGKGFVLERGIILNLKRDFITHFETRHTLCHGFHGFYDSLRFSMVLMVSMISVRFSMVFMVSMISVRFPWFPWFPYFLCGFHGFCGFYAFLRFPWFPWFLGGFHDFHGFHDLFAVSMVSMISSCSFHGFHDVCVVSMVSMISWRFPWFSMVSMICLRFPWFLWFLLAVSIVSVNWQGGELPATNSRTFCRMTHEPVRR